MSHYVCPRCLGVADHPKVCETPGCTLEGEALKECHCTDGKHESQKNIPDEKEKE